MTDEELVHVVGEFRKGLLAGRSSRGRCAMVCWPLEGYLRAVGAADCRAVESDLGGFNHVWLLLPDGRALDPTLDQFNCLFNESWPEVYLGPLTKYHVV